MSEDKRELLKGYGVVCKTPEQADKMVEFVGDMFFNRQGFDSDSFNVLQYSNTRKGFTWSYESIFLAGGDYNHLGNKTYEEACAMCGIGEVEPSFENPVEMEVGFDGASWQKRYVAVLPRVGGAIAIMDGGKVFNAGTLLRYWPHCKPIKQEPPQPKMRYMTPLEVIQQHTDKCVYMDENNDVFTCFNSSWIVKNRKVCRDRTQPIDEWKWEELKTEDK